jgi:hypothetical protein
VYLTLVIYAPRYLNNKQDTGWSHFGNADCAQKLLRNLRKRQHPCKCGSGTNQDKNYRGYHPCRFSDGVKVDNSDREEKLWFPEIMHKVH